MTKAGLPQATHVPLVTGHGRHRDAGSSLVLEPSVEPLPERQTLVISPRPGINSSQIPGPGLLRRLPSAEPAAHLLLAPTRLRVHANVHCVRPRTMSLATALDSPAVLRA